MRITKNTIRIIALVFTLLIVGIIVFFLVKAYRFLQIPDKDIVELITPSTFMVVKCDNLRSIKELDNDDYAYLDALLDKNNATDLRFIINYADSLSYMHSITRNNPLYISLAYKDSKLSYLYVWEIGKKNNATINKFLNSLQQRYNNQSFLYKHWEVVKMTVNEKTIYYTYTNGLLLFATDEQSMYASLNQLLEPPENASSFFVKSMERWKTNTNTSVNLLVRQSIFNHYISENKCGFIDDYLWEYLSVFQKAELDVSFKNGKIVFSGDVFLDTAHHQHKFYQYTNQTTTHLKLLPKNTTFITGFFGKDFVSLSTLYQSKRSMSEDFMTMMKPNTVFSFHLEEEDTLISYILIKSDDIEEAKFHLNNCLNSAFDNNIYLLDTFYENGLMVGGIDVANFFLTRFQMAKEIKRIKAYTVIDDYVLFSDSKKAISRYINLLKDNELLSADTNFTALDTYFSEGCNFLYYKKNKYNQLSTHSIEKNLALCRLQLNYQRDNKLFFNFLLQLK